MLKLSYILLIVTVAMAVGLAANFKAPGQNPGFIGSSACGSCHASRATGSALIDWQSGPHVDAFATLNSREARQILADEEIDISSCLQCHSTITHAPIGKAQQRIQSEGVGCERCHGPGSEYSLSAVMRKEGGLLELGGNLGSLAQCGSCHVTVENDTGPICPVDSSAIDPIDAWERIGHSRDTSLFDAPSWDSIVRPDSNANDSAKDRPILR
jgi:hypothetical protein